MSVSSLFVSRVVAGASLVAGLLVAVPAWALQNPGNSPAAPAASGPSTAGRNGGGPGQGRPNGGPWEWWNDSDVRRELGLSPDKVQKIQDIYTTRSQLLKPTTDEFFKELSTLDALSRARTVDEGTFALQVNKVEYLRSKIGESRTVMLYRMSLVLSPEQHRKLIDIRNRRDRDRERERGSQPK